ncbi:universal stress protein [Natronobeatus ordinarius]|uniref:universal stress protein n=1 Tax=Natronobeatus ordinarius TaxID=2963433 RepID=UPI0020CEE7AE|nr:universal stress protein [Natronobeatus ordinarius]
MPTYDTIVVPTDGSRPANRGLEHALAIAADNDADVHLVRIVDSGRYGEATALTSYEVALEKLEDEAASELESMAERARERGLTVECHCSRGTPHERIVELAEDVDADLVVMGKHGEGQAETPHLGSVADRVIRSTDRPVFTV